MNSKVVKAPLIVLAFFLMFSSAWSRADSGLVYYVNVDDEPLALILMAKDVSQYGSDDLSASDRFYDVQVQSEPKSKGRIAFIDGQWQGMLLRSGSVHMINNITTSPQNLASDTSLNAQAVKKDLNLGSCGVATSLPTVSDSTINVQNLNAQATQIDYDTFCSELVDDVCIVAELTMVFDTAFRDTYGSSYQSQAIAILENVDLIYRNNFNIAFNRLRMAYGSGDIFSTTTDSEMLLEDIAEKRYYDETDPFDPNEQSIMHLITGRNFDGVIAGIANAPLYDSYPTPNMPVMCTYVAVGTSQIIGSGSNRNVYTSLVVAHEIGHNLGFMHDGVPGEGADACSSTDFIMGDTLTPGVSSFSSCSREALGPNLNAINTIESCFDFPAEMSISADAGNPTEVDTGQQYTGNYTITSLSRSDQSINARLIGSVTSSAATFLSADLDGSPCTLSNSNTTYTCSISGASTHNLALNIQAAISDVAINHQVSSTNANIFDINQSNNLLIEAVRLPNSGRSESSASSGSSGGGGSLNWLTLGLLTFISIRRKYTS